MGKLDSDGLTVADVIALAKARLGLKSNYALCKHLGIQPNAMSHWMHERSWPNAHFAALLAEAAGLDPDALAAYFQGRRTLDPEAAQTWFRIARRLENEAILRRRIAEFSETLATDSGAGKPRGAGPVRHPEPCDVV